MRRGDSKRALAMSLILRAVLTRHVSLLPVHSSGPPISRTIPRVRSIAVNATDIASTPAGFDDFSTIGCLMLLNMRKPTNRTNWISIGTLARGLAARLVAARDEFQREENAATPKNADAAAVPPREESDAPSLREVRGGTGAPCKADAGLGAAWQNSEFRITTGDCIALKLGRAAGGCIRPRDYPPADLI